MRFLDKGKRAPDDGAADGSRAVLILAICFFILCTIQAAMSLASGSNVQRMLDRAYMEASEP